MARLRHASRLEAIRNSLTTTTNGKTDRQAVIRLCASYTDRLGRPPGGKFGATCLAKN